MLLNSGCWLIGCLGAFLTVLIFLCLNTTNRGSSSKFNGTHQAQTLSFLLPEIFFFLLFPVIFWEIRSYAANRQI